MTLSLMRTAIAAGAAAVVCAGVPVRAAQVTLTGALSIPTQGSLGPLGIGQTTTLNFLDASHRFEGTVQATNTLVNGVQRLDLRLTALRYQTYLPGGPETVTLTLEQLFEVSAQALGTAQARHEFIGVANILAAGQLAQVQADSTHEGVALPRLEYNASGQYSTSGGGWRPINLQQQTPLQVSVSGAYRIRSTYVFTLDTNQNCDWMAIELAGNNPSISSGADLLLVPLPPGAWAGLGGLAMVAGMWAVRRTRHSAPLTRVQDVS